MVTLKKTGKLLMILQLSSSVYSTHGSTEKGLPKKCRRLAYRNLESRGERLGAAAELTGALADFAPSGRRSSGFRGAWPPTSPGGLLLIAVLAGRVPAASLRLCAAEMRSPCTHGSAGSAALCGLPAS